MGKHGGKTVIQYPSPSIFPQNPAARCISLRLLAHNPINTGGRAEPQPRMWSLSVTAAASISPVRICFEVTAPLVDALYGATTFGHQSLAMERDHQRCNLELAIGRDAI
jgi:hypothetical protein